MSDEPLAREERAVLVHTLDGAVKGCLHISPRMRTLDNLNMVSKQFIRLHSVESLIDDWTSAGSTISINKSSILFVRELSNPAPCTDAQFGSHTRAPIRLHVRNFEIQGFVHMSPGGVPMKQFDHGNHAFVSLTTVLIDGPDEQVTAAFMAVNREHVTFAEELGVGERPTGLPVALGETEI